MHDKRVHFPWVVPTFIAIVVAVASVTSPYVDSTPSSTAGLGFAITPFVGPAIGIAVFGVTLGAAILLQRWRLPRKLLRAPALLLLVSPLVGVALACLADAWLNYRLSPHVVQTSERVRRLESALECPVQAIDPARFMPGPGAHNGIELQWTPVHLSIPSRRSLHVDCKRGGGASASFSFPDYIAYVRAWPLGSGSAAPIALAVDFRATSRASAVIVISNTGTVLHWEVMERPGGVGELEVRIGECPHTFTVTLSAIGGPALAIDPPD